MLFKASLNGSTKASKKLSYFQRSIRNFAKKEKKKIIIAT